MSSLLGHLAGLKILLLPPVGVGGTGIEGAEARGAVNRFTVPRSVSQGNYLTPNVNMCDSHHCKDLAFALT